MMINKIKKLFFIKAWPHLKQISVFDYLGISFFLIIIGISAFFFLRKAKYVTVTLRISEFDSINLWVTPPLWYIDVLQPGMVEKDGLGREVIRVESVETSLSGSENKIAFVDLSVRAVYNKRTNQYSYNGVPLLVGGFQTFNLQGVLVPGVIHRIGDKAKRDEGRYVRVRGSVAAYLIEEDRDITKSFGDGVSDFRADKYTDDLNLMSSTGRTLIDVISVTRLPASRLLISSAGVQKLNDPSKKKIELEMDVLVSKVGDQDVFLEEQIVKVGRILYINFSEIDTPITIEEVLEINNE
jgi:hypothetical protein